MFVENKKFTLFAQEFKRCYKELIKGLEAIWGDYDYDIGVGDPYAQPEFSKEEAEKRNADLEDSLLKLVSKVSSEFKLQNYSDFIKRSFTFLMREYKQIRWLENLLDYDCNGKIENPIDLYSAASEFHQGTLNLVIGSLDLSEGEETRSYLKKYVRERYKARLDEQTQPIIDEYRKTLEIFWNQIIFLNLKDNENESFLVDLGEVVVRKPPF